MSAVEEVAELLASDTPPDDHRHFFYKPDLDENLLNGTPVTALCGFVKEGLAHPDTSAPVCERCREIWTNHLDHGDDE